MGAISASFFLGLPLLFGTSSVGVISSLMFKSILYIDYIFFYLNSLEGWEGWWFGVGCCISTSFQYRHKKMNSKKNYTTDTFKNLPPTPNYQPKV